MLILLLGVVFRDFSTEKYRGQATQFAEIPFSADVGIMLVDSKALRQQLLPSPSKYGDMS